MEGVGEFEYNTKDLIGHGAFAVVFKGRHKVRNELVVAIKSITKKNLAKSQNLLGKEIKILKELTELHHENVVALLDCKETQNHVFLVMEYCNGGDLADYLHGKGTLSEDTIRLFLRQIAGAMKALNAKGIVHRDLKPQNILLCHKSDRVNPPPTEIKLKIADFGFARFLNEGVMAATLCGSPMYMAPEVIMSLQYDAKADLWSIGTIVFQCLTGKAPFHAQTPQALKQFYEKTPNLAPKIPAGTSQELTELLLRLLKRNAKDRMEFDDFFDHSFLQPPQTSITKPVPVPRSLSGNGHSSASSSPLQSPISYGSPLMMQMTANSPKQGTGEYPVTPASSTGSDEQVDDFVVIPASGSNFNNHGRASPRGADKLECEPRPRAVSCGSAATHMASTPEPLPVPTQREAYERIQRSCGKAMDIEMLGNKNDNNNSNNNNITVAAPVSPFTGRHKGRGNESGSSLGSEGSGSRFQTDVAQLSPPSVQFVIGTPPGPAISASHASLVHSQRRRQSAPLVINTSISGQTSPISRQLTPPSFSPMSVHSPLRYGLYGQSPALAAVGAKPESQNPLKRTLQNSGGDSSAPIPSGTNRLLALNEGSQQSQGHTFPFNKFCGQQPFNQYFPQTQNAYHMCCCPSNPMLPLAAPFASRQPLNSSPTNMEGPVMFVAPELPEETLLDREHNETLAKLNFVLTLVECVIELAESRANPLSVLTESACKELPGESYRKAEQILLYYRSLQLISSAMQLSRQEHSQKRLRASNSVKLVLGSLRKLCHHCLNMLKSLDMNSVITNQRDLEGLIADKLIYNYAIEMCQSAALEELFGHPEECFRRYQTAQILLHSLSQQVNDQDDRQLLNRYKEAVEKRLYVLQSQGIVLAYDNNTSSP